MNIMLGNLNVKQIEERLEIILSEDDCKFLSEKRTDFANGEKGKYHCFDIPFMLKADSLELAKEIHDRLSKYKIKGSVQISY